MNTPNLDPETARLASMVLELMWNERIGVIPATFSVIVREVEGGELSSTSERVSKAVTDHIKEHEELRDAIVQQLRTDRGTPFHDHTPTHMSASARALARIEDEAPVIEIPPPAPLLIDNQYHFRLAVS